MISFAIDPNLPGWTGGTQRILWNALPGPDPAGASLTSLASERRTAAERRARLAAEALPPVAPHRCV